MGRRNDRWAAPRPGPRPIASWSGVTDPATGDAAGQLEPPADDYILRSGPVEITVLEAAPPRPVPPPFDRAETLAAIQAGFAGLDDTQLTVAMRRILGLSYFQIGIELGLAEETAKSIWKGARDTLGVAIFGPADPVSPAGAAAQPPSEAPAVPVPPSP